jgi:zinc D-Ala-D-Ala carboxypeptidase
MTDQRIGHHFWLSEFLSSETAVRRGIDNTPSAMAMANVINVLAPGMQRVRNCLENPVFITSGYRSPEVNKAVGGSPNSQHCQGLAADFKCPQFSTPRGITKYLMERSGEIRFDQLIYEGAWCHISFPELNSAPRSEVLTAHFMGGTVVYRAGLA